MKEIFYQSSLPRAGSTLLQNIMGQNPEFYVTPTSGVLELLFSARHVFSTLNEFKAQDTKTMEKGFASFCRYGVKGFFEGITDKPYVLDKSRGWGIHYGFLKTFQDDPKIICLLRDPVDIFSSMEKKFRINQQLSDPIVDWGSMKGTTTTKRVNIWSQTTPIGMAFERLQQLITEGIDKKILFIKFEDLTKQPESEIRKVYEFIGLPYYEGHDFNNVKQVTFEDDTIYGIYGDHTIKPIVKPPKRDALEVLGNNLVRDIQTKYNWFYDLFY